MLVLLLLLAVGMLSLSTASIRITTIDNAMEEARTNARMALMLAIGELQTEMGPDMRISAEAALFDRRPDTPAIDGIAQPHWMAVYDSWGNYLNAPYTPEGKDASSVDSIQDTYSSRRTPMFRRWLVSMPESQQTTITSVFRMPAEEDSVIMVGPGTLGQAYAQSNPNKITRAFKIQSGDTGAFAWWISPENHKAKVNLAAQQRELDAEEWAVRQGTAAEVAVGGLDALGNLDADANLADRVVSFKTLTLPSVTTDQDMTKSMFFDLTNHGSGILANTRSGGLKKDLSLLFENDHSTIPAMYKQADTAGYDHSRAAEPSIRPLSKDILAENAAVPRRPFTSWPRMRHYYRTYRQDTDPRIARQYKGQPTRNLQRDFRGIPYTEPHAPENMRNGGSAEWQGQNTYDRIPVLLRYLCIHGYVTEPGPGPDETTVRYLDIPIVTLWNPYSTPLLIRNGDYGMAATSMEAWPNRMVVHEGTTQTELEPASYQKPAPILSLDGTDTIFKPGEIKVFSFSGRGVAQGNIGVIGFREGFDPALLGGVPGQSYIMPTSALGTASLDVKFSKIIRQSGNGWWNPELRNGREGNTPGSPSLRMGLAAGTTVDPRDDGTPAHYQIDWFQPSQRYQSILGSVSNRVRLVETPDPLPIAYSVLTLKTTQSLPPAVGWARDWRSRNWLHQPPYGYGGGLYMTNDGERRAHTQRLESSYTVSFGPATSFELLKLTGVNANGDPVLGIGSNPYEKVSAVAAIELPTAPISSLASFSGMRTNPGWAWCQDLDSRWTPRNRTGGADRELALYAGFNKMFQYQSGITGGGIGNSFGHPMIPRDKVYHFHNNSVSTHERNTGTFETVDTKAYSDYWDHTFVLNDALWDEYFISSMADQTRPWASASDNLNDNIQALTNGEGLPISRYQYHAAGLDEAEVRTKLTAEDGYLRVAEHLKVDGAFNVNSTSVNAWYALFKGIRERKLYYRDTTSGTLREVDVPEGHIAVSRMDIPTTNRETSDLSNGVMREDGEMVWSGVRFISDEQIRVLAEKCVEQVKQRGPFLNMSEFINRRLQPQGRRGRGGRGGGSADLALMGALQNAIDFDDASPDSRSINYRFKSSNNLRIDPGNLGNHEYPTADAVEGSRLAGIPGYVIQSDLLKPIANTLQVRDDTFRIRAYGETLNAKGEVIARAWCEAILQRNTEYVDPTNDPYEPAFIFEGNPLTDSHDPGWDGEFTPNSNLTPTNRRFGRKFEMKSFRWLSSDEV